MSTVTVCSGTTRSTSRSTSSVPKLLRTPAQLEQGGRHADPPAFWREMDRTSDRSVMRVSGIVTMRKRIAATT